MKKKNNISYKTTLLKYTAALLMCGCLLFLTGINFIVYGADAKSISIALQAAENSASDESSPEKPAEGKSSTGTVNIQEEYVHEISLIHSLALVDDPKQYRLLDDARLAIVHFELLSPPPNS
ncbi:MAG: hypothetical protein WAR78_09635 [Ferruginibacter sp.]